MRIVLGLGSNCGDRLGFLKAALQKLRSPSITPRIEIVKVSPIYESKALLPDGAPLDWDRPFLNMAVLCEASQEIELSELLITIKAIEKSLGRQNRSRWSPREIDIDILSAGNLEIKTESLVIPHAGLLDRPFACLPFADVYPQWVVPGKNHSISEWVSRWKRAPRFEVPFETQRTSLSLTELMGILNVTPDSFSDGGKFFTAENALIHIQDLISKGCTLVDIGAESTRPGATPLTPDQEWMRLEPVLVGIQSLQSEQRSQFKVSVDTRHSETAIRSLKAGANWINDVSGLEDPNMIQVVRDFNADLVLMHSLCIPANPQVVWSSQVDPVIELKEWALKKINFLEANGIPREKVIIDPGIGFGKTLEQTWEIFRNLSSLRSLGCRLLIGHSRKSFLKNLAPGSAETRDPETIAVTLDLVEKGIEYIRVHQVEMNHRAIKAWTHVNGLTQ